MVERSRDHPAGRSTRWSSGVETTQPAGAPGGRAESRPPSRQGVPRRYFLQAMTSCEPITPLPAGSSGFSHGWVTRAKAMVPAVGPVVPGTVT